MTLECPSSVVEGGLVAQATNCSDPNLPIGHPYCEYRNFPGIAINAHSTDPTSAGVGPNGRDEFKFEILNADGGVYGYTIENLLLYVSGGVYRSGITDCTSGCREKMDPDTGDFGNTWIQQGHIGVGQNCNYQGWRGTDFLRHRHRRRHGLHRPTQFPSVRRHVADHATLLHPRLRLAVARLPSGGRPVIAAAITVPTCSASTRWASAR